MTTDPRDALICRLADLLMTRMTKAGHMAMTVPWEHRGGCPITGCQKPCLEMQQAIRDATDHLERVIAEQPQQAPMFAEVAG